MAGDGHFHCNHYASIRRRLLLANLHMLSALEDYGGRGAGCMSACHSTQPHWSNQYGIGLLHVSSANFLDLTVAYVGMEKSDRMCCFHGWCDVRHNLCSVRDPSRPLTRFRACAASTTRSVISIRYMINNSQKDMSANLRLDVCK